MKRYILFGGDNYYPRGGVDGLIGSYNMLEEAQAEGERRMTLRLFYDSDHIEWFTKLNTQGEDG